jgi:hypothetical protein
MDRVSLGFIIAGLYNSGIGLFSKGFSDNLGAVDSLFSGAGCVGIQLWGLAYFALAQRYSVAPAVALVFCLEKFFYAQHWLFWLSKHSGELPAMIEADPLTGGFFSIYGLGDIAFMFFFGWVAWRWRENLVDSKA